MTNSTSFTRFLEKLRRGTTTTAEEIDGLGLSPSVTNELHQLDMRLVDLRREEAATELFVNALSIIAMSGGLEATLEVICRHTRALFDSNMAYVSLNDSKANETYIKTTSGVQSKEYRALRMPLGTGILGQAAGGENIASTNNYLADPTIPHIPEVDLIVKREGVQSILAATMRVQGEVIGALLIADRYDRTYRNNEASLLEKIAGVAAIALQQQFHVESLQAIIAERDEATAQAQERLEQLVQLQRLDQGMMDIVRNAGDPEDIEQYLSTELTLDVRIRRTLELDAHHLHTGGHYWRHNCAAFDGQEVLSFRITDGRQMLGVIEAPMVEDDSRLPLLARTAAVVGALLANEELRYQADRNVQGELLRKLKDGDADFWETNFQRAKPFGLAIGATSFVVAVHVDMKFRAQRTIYSLVDQRGGLVAENEDIFLIVSPQVTGQEVEQRLSKIGVTNCTIATRDTILHRKDLMKAISQTERGVRMMRALGISGVSDARYGLGVSGLAVASMPPNTLHQLVRGALAPVIEYDHARATNLVETALHVLEADGNFSTAAKTLFIHPNTVRQRVERISNLIGEGWNEGARRAEIHIMLKLWKVIQSVKNSTEASNT